MNAHNTPDDLPVRLNGLGDELQRPPRPDARIDRILGSGPPVAGAAEADATDVIALPLTGPTPKRRTAWIAVAAALSLLAGVGLAAYALAGDDPVLPATAAGGDESDDSPEESPSDDAVAAETDPADDEDDPEGDPDADPESDPDDAHAWLECVTVELGGFFGNDSDVRGGEFPSIDECGDPPAMGGWFPFDEFPDLDSLPDAWSLPGLGDWSSLDGLCSSESTDAGVEVECVWPPCPEDDADCPFPPACDTGADGSETCFGFDFGFGIEIDPDGFGFSVPFGGEGSFFFDPEMLPDTFPDLPDDFEFPRDLPELDEWFESFPWAEEFEGLFGPPEPADA